MGTSDKLASEGYKYCRENLNLIKKESYVQMVMEKKLNVFGYICRMRS